MDIDSLLNFSHYFSTNVFSVFALNPERDSRYSIAIDAGLLPDNLAIPEQIHSNCVKWIDSPGPHIGLDGLITENPNIILSLKVADCVPIYFFEPKINMIGLIHSGWRGTVDGIVPTTVKLMHQQGADLQKILVYLGPSIGGCCYEVDEYVANSFDRYAKIKIENHKWKINLHEQIKIQLETAGIPLENMQNSNICTLESNLYHSYRRDGEKSGRMFAFMVLK